MIDIMTLSREEMDEICRTIGFKNIKEYFRKTEKGFRQIGKGYSPQGMPDKIICTRLYQNLKLPYVKDLFQFFLEQWKEGLDDEVKKNTEISMDAALVLALCKPQFSMNPILYCKLFEEGKDGRADLLNFAVEQAMANQKSENHQDAVQLEVYQQQQEELHKTQAALTIASDQWAEKERALTGEIRQLQETQTQYIEQIAQLQSELTRAKETLEPDAQAEIKNTEADKAYFARFQHTSICLVGTDMLYRYADLVDETFQEFVQDPNKRFIYENRDKLYHKWMEHYPVKFIGLFNWNAKENRNDPNNDYIESFYDEEHFPIEIIRVISCDTLRAVVEHLKNGVSKRWSGKKMMFVFPRSENSYYGICCTDDQFKQKGDYYYLKPEIVALNAYEISTDDILHIHDYRFLKQLYPTRFVCKVPLFDLVGVVKQKLLERITWTAVKMKGITKKDWQFWKDYLKELYTDDFYEEIVEACQCSREDAEQAAKDLIEYAEEHLSGTDVGTEIIAHIARNDAKLRSMCMEQLRSEWEAQHEELVEKLKNERETLQGVTQKHEKLQATLATVQEQIQKHERIAEDVESNIAERIRAARQDAAKFISEMAFCSPSVQKVSDVVETAEWIHSGVEWKSDTADMIETLEDLIDSLSAQLREAGVMDVYSDAVAAFLFTAYRRRIPVLLAGPNARSIADAFSITLTGKTCASVNCLEQPPATQIQKLSEFSDEIIAIENPFTQEWLNTFATYQSALPYRIYLHPFAEDLQIEPKGVFHYMIPLLTELVVDTPPTGNFFSCQWKERLIVPETNAIRTPSISLLKQCGLSAYTFKQLRRILSDMKPLIPAENMDADVLLGVIPALYWNGKLESMYEQLQSIISEGAIEAIHTLAGDTV